MGRKLLVRQHLHPYHVYNRVNSCRHYPASLLDEIWQMYCDTICIMTWVFGLRVHAFVLMSNHYHMMASTPDGNLDTAMLYFHREISRGLKALTGTQDYRFQSRYKWKVIENHLQFENTYRYIALNPVEAKAVNAPFDYQYSTFAAQFGRFRLLCPVAECQAFAGFLPDDMEARELWLCGGAR